MLADSAEQLALETVLPRLGFREIYHISKVHGFFPFDFVASHKQYEGRVLVEVTTTLTKPLTRLQKIANALRMRLFVLFIRPDLKAYQLVDVSDFKHRFVSVRKSEIVTLA